MRLQPESRLGKFEIASAIGSGGMGEVYKARDLELDREVVIKVLPEKMATRSRRLRRFKQEARAASALNHPNIVTVYEIGDYDGTPYIVMEYVEGKTLRQMLAGGPFPADKVLRYAAQMAEGLAKAHQAGIVHRDLKPENILINDDDYVKIVDFGLAKLLSSQRKVDSEGTTVSHDGTTPGMMLGTLGYMSPEQVRGRAIDVRSDQFAFGAVLYEMVSGRRAFHARSRSEAIAAIINQNPAPLRELRPDAPERLCDIIHRCLEKKPKKRFATTSELSESLSSLLHSGATSRTPPAESERRLPRRIIAGAGIAAVLITLAFLLIVRDDTGTSEPIPEVASTRPGELPATSLVSPPDERHSPPKAAAPAERTTTATAQRTIAAAPTTSTSVSPATVPPTSTSVPPEQAPANEETPRSDDESAIRETLATFVRAIESERLDLYRQVKPNITVEESQRLRASFDSVEAHDVMLRIDSITIDGDSASVRASRTDVIVIRGRSQDGITRTQTFDLTKSGGRWVIVRLRQ